MSDPLDEVYELAALAEALPEGPAKIAVWEEAVRRTDAAGDVELGYRVRDRLMAAALHGRADLLLVHFSWCLARFDEDPEPFNEHSLLWKYKWVCGNVLQFPDVPLAQVEQLSADMAARFERYGAGRRAVAMHRLELALHRGDEAAATAALEAFRDQPRDALSDCPACEADEVVRYHLFIDQRERGVAAASDILAGKLTCRTVPQRTHARLLLPLLQLDRTEEAAGYHKTAARTFARCPPSLWQVGAHVEFLALTGNLPKAVRLADKFLVEAETTPELSDAHDYWLGLHFLCDRLTAAGRASVRLKFPADHPLHREKGGRPVAEVADYADGKATDIGRRFDARNGTAGFARRREEVSGLGRYAREYPL